MHKDTPGALLSYRGHSLTADEFHSALIGTAVALLYDEESVLGRTLGSEPWYALGAFTAVIVARKWLRSD